MTIDEKKRKLRELKREMVADKTLPLRRGATQLVFGDGNSDADIYFIGEAPGFNEDKLGIPFIGRAGKLLEETMKLINMRRRDVYISNIVRFRPPENRDPTPNEIEAFQPYVDREIEIIDPLVIVTLGRFSMNKFLPGVKISQVHGKPTKMEWNKREIYVIPMYHPAAAMRARVMMESFKADFIIIPQILKQAQDEFVEVEKERTKPNQESLF